MKRCLPLALAPLLTVALVGCGGDGKDKPAPRFATTTTAMSEPPPLARTPAKAGEYVFTGAASPISFSAFELDGNYVVRFEQYAPEDPKLDFSSQTPFTALLRREGSEAQGGKLFGAASARGLVTLTRRGRYVLDVTFGDFPFAVRFTKRR